MASKRKRPSKKQKSDQSYPHTAPPIAPASAPLSSFPTLMTNPMPPGVYPSYVPNTSMSRGQSIVLPSQSNPLLDLLPASPSIPTGLGNTHLGAVHGVGQSSSGHSAFRDTAHVPSISSSFGAVVSRSGQILLPDERSVRNGFPHRQGNDGHQASRPPELGWIIENPAEASANPVQRRHAPNQRATIEAGGSCLWCYKSKKSCGIGVPCYRCRQNKFPCVRGSYSALCMALTKTIKPGDRYELDPDNFRKAQETLEQLTQDLQPSAFPAVIRWLFRNDRYRETLISTADQIEMRQANSTLRKTLVDLFIAPRSTLSDSLPRDAHRMLGLLATTKVLFNSFCFIEAVTIKTARVILFSLMTIVTMELCKVSLRLAKSLYPVLNNKSTATESKRYALRIYFQVIDGILESINLEWRYSLMSDIFVHMQPQLESLRKILHQLVLEEGLESTSDAKNSFDSDLLMIGFPYEMRERFAPAGFIQGIHQYQQHYSVNLLLRSDFDDSMANPTTDSQIVNPLWLSRDISQSNTITNYEASTALDSSHDPAIFSDGTETRNTEITSPPPDATDFFDSAYESTLATFGSSSEDFAFIGNHLS